MIPLCVAGFISCSTKRSFFVIICSSMENDMQQRKLFPIIIHTKADQDVYQNRPLKHLGIIIKWIQWDKIVTLYQKKNSVCWQKVVHSDRPKKISRHLVKKIRVLHI